MATRDESAFGLRRRFVNHMAMQATKSPAGRRERALEELLSEHGNLRAAYDRHYGQKDSGWKQFVSHVRSHLKPMGLDL